MTESPHFLIVTGVSGAGKSTVAEALAQRLHWPMRDADEFHPPGNVAKMSAGLPLDDEDRGPWLAAIAGWIDAHRHAGQSAIVTCSALKRAYREVLVGGHNDVTLVFLFGSPELIGVRMAARKGHFMPPQLLASQLATLEAPEAGEPVLRVSIEATPAQIAGTVLAALNLG